MTLEASVSITIKALLMRSSLASTRASTKAAFYLSNEDYSVSIHTNSGCDQVSKGCSSVSIASYKFAIIIGEAEELLNLF